LQKINCVLKGAKLQENRQDSGLLKKRELCRLCFEKWDETARLWNDQASTIDDEETRKLKKKKPCLRELTFLKTKKEIENVSITGPFTADALNTSRNPNNRTESENSAPQVTVRPNAEQKFRFSLTLRLCDRLVSVVLNFFTYWRWGNTS